MEIAGLLLKGIICFFTLWYTGFLVFSIKGWAAIPRFRRVEKEPHTRVSVLIAARNEAGCIAALLDDLLIQDYPQSLTEIIVINDHSTDLTAAVVQAYAPRGVKLINLNEDRTLNSYKKKAIERGIEQSTGRLIVTTDADCRLGPQWLSSIAGHYESTGAKLISAPVAYHHEHSLFEKCQSLEFTYLIALGAASIGNRTYWSCNGANLAYEREAFEAVGGFNGIDQIASGDDELLMHKIASEYPGTIVFLKSRDAIVYTLAKPDLKLFIEQRKRWASKSTRYQHKPVIFKGIMIWLFNLSLFISLLVTLFFPTMGFVCWLGGQWLVKMLVEALFLFSPLHFFKRKQLLVLLPLTNTVHVFYLVFIGLAGNTGKYKWKDRMVH